MRTNEAIGYDIMTRFANIQMIEVSTNEGIHASGVHGDFVIQIDNQAKHCQVGRTRGLSRIVIATDDG